MNGYDSHSDPRVLLLRFYSNDITDAEAGELLSVLDRHPEFLDEIDEEYSFELHLRTLAERENLKKSFRDLESREKEDVRIDSLFFPEGSTLDWALLNRMERESKTILPPVPVKKPKERLRHNPRAYRPEESGLLKQVAAPLLLFGLIATAIYLEFAPSAAVESIDGDFSPIGRIVAVADPAFPDDASTFKTGQALGNEKIVLDRGSLEIELESDVRLVLEGPAEFHLHSDMKTFCRSGRLSAEVPPRGKGFEVATPKLTIRDLGTEFTLNVTPEKTEAHVIKGEIEINWMTKGWLPFRENRGLRFFSMNDFEQIAADVGTFVGRNLMRERAEIYEIARSERLRDMQENRSADPSLRFRFLAETAFRREEGVSISGCRSIPGSRIDTVAALFSGANDRIEASIPAEASALTMIAMVRIDRIDTANTIFFCNDFYREPGTFFWQIDRSGRLQFHLRRSSSSGTSIAYFDSAPVFKARDRGTWTNLAVTVDAAAGKVVHYIDGRPAGSVSEAVEKPLRLGPVTIGNDISGRKKTSTSWNGAVESLYLFDRVLSPEEIGDFQ